MIMQALIDAQGVTKHYEGFALDAFDITVAPDRVVGLIGSNGAGKTTLLKSILGMISLDGGAISLLESDPQANAAESAAAKQDIGVVLDTCAFPVSMKVSDVRTLGRAAYARWDDARFDQLCIEFDLTAKKSVKDLSRGMGMKLTLAFALAHHPKLLILDEVTAGLDPIARDEVLEILRSFMEEEGHAILISSHITTDLEKIADEIVCIDEGAMVFALPKETICDEAGIAHCRTSELEAIASSEYGIARSAADTSGSNAVCATASPDVTPLKFLPRGLATDLLVPDRVAFARAFPDIEVERVSIEDYMTLTLKGETL